MVEFNVKCDCLSIDSTEDILHIRTTSTKLNVFNSYKESNFMINYKTIFDVILSLFQCKNMKTFVTTNYF